MTDRNYKDINLNRAIIEETISRFVDASGVRLRGVSDKPGSPGLRVIIGSAGIEDATVEIFFNNTESPRLLWRPFRLSQAAMA